jgi:WD40 repeat protein
VKLIDFNTRAIVNNLSNFHDGVIFCIEFSTNCKTIATVSADLSIKIFDTKRDRLIVKFGGGHSAHVTSCKFSPNGNFIVTSAKDGTLSLWNISKKKKFFTKKLWPNEIIFTCDYSPDSKYLVAGCNNGSIKIIQIVTRKVIKVFQGTHTDFINTVTFSNSGKLLASGSSDKTLKLYSLGDSYHDYTEICQWQTTFTQWVRTCAFNRDDSLIAAGCYAFHIRIFSTKTFEIIHFFQKAHNAWVMNIKFCADDKYLVSSGQDGYVNFFRIGQQLTQKKFAVSYGEDGGLTQVVLWHDKNHGNSVDSEDADYEETGHPFAAPNQVIVVKGHCGDLYSYEFEADGFVRCCINSVHTGKIAHSHLSKSIFFLFLIII